MLLIHNHAFQKITKNTNYVVFMELNETKREFFDALVFQKLTYQKILIQDITHCRIVYSKSNALLNF